MTGQRERNTDDGRIDTENAPRVIEAVGIECVCGAEVTGDTVGDAEANHITHLLDSHDIAAVNRHQLRETLSRKEAGQ